MHTPLRILIACLGVQGLSGFMGSSRGPRVGVSRRASVVRDGAGLGKRSTAEVSSDARVLCALSMVVALAC